jgi:hypothetical protein
MAGQGRHSEYTPEIGMRICELTATHAVGIKALRKQYPDLPDDTTIASWRFRHDDFARQYVKAKQLQAELLADQIVDISDDSSRDIVTGKNGDEQCNTEFVARSRLRVDSRKWIASKLAPKIYGDRQIIEQTTTENEQLKAELAELRAKLADKAKSEY